MSIGPRVQKLEAKIFKSFILTIGSIYWNFGRKELALLHGGIPLDYVAKSLDLVDTGEGITNITR